MIKRLDWIDSYRGILVLLVVVGHLDVPMHVFDGLRIPGFFFISGYLLSQKYNDFIYFFQHRFRQIVVPYIAFFLIVYILTTAINILTGKGIELVDPILAMLYGSFSWDMGYSKSLWFVTALFTTEMGFYFIKKYAQKNNRIVIVLFACSALGYLSTFLNFRLPWGLDIACTTVLFYGLGYLVKTNGLISRIDIKNTYLRIFVSMILLLISYYFCYGDNQAVFVLNQISNPVYMILSAFIGIISTILMMKTQVIGQNRLLIYFGKNTFVVLAFHEFLMHIGVKLTLLTTGINPEMGGFEVRSFYVFFTLLLLIPTIEVINYFFPFILKHKGNMNGLWVFNK